MASHIGRRKFLATLGGAAVWPFAARAQQRRRIGVLMPFNPGDREAEARRVVFEQSLHQLGWALGQNVHIEYRLTGSAVESISRHAADWLRSLRTQSSPLAPWHRAFCYRRPAPSL